MSMQMDAEFEEEQIGALFVWVGAPEGGCGWWDQGGQAQNRACLPSEFFSCLLSIH